MITLFIDKYNGFVDKKGAPDWAPEWLTGQSRRSQNHEKHTSRGRGGGNEPPAGLTGQSPDAYLVISVLSFISLDIL